MKKTLCIHQSAELYGSDRSFYSAIQGLKNKFNIDVILPFQGELSNRIEKDNIDIAYFNKGILRKKDILNPIFFIWNVMEGVKYYVKAYKSYDVIYINTIVMLSAIIAAFFYRNKKIYCHVREIPGRKVIFFFKLLFRLTGISLIYNSEATRVAFGLPGSVVYNGVSAITTNIKKNESGNNTNILLIGRINTWKGQSFFIDALLLYAEKFKNIPFNVKIVGSAFAGYEYLEQELRNKILKNGIDKHIELISFTDNPTDFYQWADYVIVPSIKPEPFGRVAVEAFSAGKPVIAAKHGGLVEIVDDGFNGYLFEPNSAESLVMALDLINKMNFSDYELMCQNAVITFEKKFSLKKYQESICNILS
ncbi:glycosyltransferase family 4 protein [Klebsiella aerogenes]|nr:glycosyltransferase family 4 protein [Klebsiella aerogenes]